MHATGMGRTLEGEPPPNPGSAEALKRGCKCPVLDNNYGEGITYKSDEDGDIIGGRMFWRNEECPLHGQW